MLSKIIINSNDFIQWIGYLVNNYYQFFKHGSIKKIFIIIFLFILFLIINHYLFKVTKKMNDYMKGKQFIDKCLNNLQIHDYNLFYNSPIFSVVIPAYNCEKTIYYPIISIQNQNLSEYEIILIDDFSKDNTSKIIQSLNQHDKRIKSVINKKNQGTLYSRCIGTLMAKGEYIFALDNDDMIFMENIFDYFYKMTKVEKYEIIGFKAVSASSYSDNIEQMKDLYSYVHPNNLYILQPKLRTWLITNNEKFSLHDLTIWAKIIKSQLYIKAINLLGKKRYSNYISWAEDSSMNVIIFSIAESFIYVQKYGILHITSLKTASFIQPINNKFYGELFLAEIIFDFTEKNKDKNYSVYMVLNSIKSYIKFKSIINKHNLKYFSEIIFKLIKSRYISKLNKFQLINSFHNFYSVL